MSAAPAPRLFGIPTTRAPVVAVLRRGPTAWSHVGRWDVARGLYEAGGRLLLATRDGRLQIRELSEHGLRVLSEADAGAETPSPAPPPPEALRW